VAESKTESKPTLDQRRARHAWEAVQELGGLKKEQAADYAGEARKLPTRIVAAGLGQALAFLAAKAKEKKPGLRLLLRHLNDWVITRRPMKAPRPDSLLESVVFGNSNFLRRATDETLSYLQWLNRFTEAAELGEAEGGG
jgi:CRISPR-associated protein Cmr5